MCNVQFMLHNITGSAIFIYKMSLCTCHNVYHYVYSCDVMIRQFIAIFGLTFFLVTQPCNIWNVTGSNSFCTKHVTIIQFLQCHFHTQTSEFYENGPDMS